MWLNNKRIRRCFTAKHVATLYLIVNTVGLGCLRGSEQALRVIEGIDTGIAYYGERGFVFPRAKGLETTDNRIGLPEAAAEYILLQLNRALREKQSTNEFVQRVFGVASISEDQTGPNILEAFLKQMEASQISAKMPELKADSPPLRMCGKGGWTNFVASFRVSNSKYRTGIVRFSLEAPYAIAGKHEDSGFREENFLNEKRLLETYLSVGSIYLAY
jgi:hypothetical protein